MKLPANPRLARLSLLFILTTVVLSGCHSGSRRGPLDSSDGDGSGDIATDGAVDGATDVAADVASDAADSSVEDTAGDLGDDTGGDLLDVPSDTSPMDISDTGSDAADLMDTTGACTEVCSDGVFCNGVERCDPSDPSADPRGCVVDTADPCPATYVCDASSDTCLPANQCICFNDSDCPASTFCWGSYTCDPGAINANSAGCVTTGIPCAIGQICDEGAQTCSDPPPVTCTSHAQCDDRRHCNGSETCNPASASADARGCVAGSPPCSAAQCDELRNCCGNGCPCADDADCGDGVWCNGHERCAPDDGDADSRGCIDAEYITATICPAIATCVENQDCCQYSASNCGEPFSHCGGNSDLDGDGVPAVGCASGGVATDCNDFDANLTNNCGACTGTTDADGDGHPSVACGGGDCDDGDPERFPGNIEVCDLDDRDEDCDMSTFGVRDVDADGFGDDRCCNGTNCGRDCDDFDPAVRPTAPELCNRLDDNCDGVIDDGTTVDAFVDSDGDGAGKPGACISILICPGTPGYATQPGDCDDSNPAITRGSMTCSPDPAIALVCTDGVWVPTPCVAGTTCVPQPNGTGLCQ